MTLIERYTRDGREVVVLRYAAAFYWLMWPTVGVTILPVVSPGVIANALAAAAWVVLLGTAVPYWPIVFELRRRMRTESITASGSKYSFANPLTYSWAIETSGESEQQ